jgi:hypothetical protein
MIFELKCNLDLEGADQDFVIGLIAGGPNLYVNFSYNILMVNITAKSR